MLIATPATVVACLEPLIKPARRTDLRIWATRRLVRTIYCLVRKLRI